MKRSHFIVTIIIALATIAASFPGAQTRLTVTDASRMWVDGTSTIHDWTCSVGKVEGSITLDAALGGVSEAIVTVPSSSIDCDNGTMNKKMASALDIKSHPTIRYILKSADVANEGGELHIDAVGTLEVAGSNKDITASLVGVPTANGGYKFSGTLPVTMSDFGIKPPTAMLGTLKSGDSVTVRFEIATVSADLSKSK